MNSIRTSSKLTAALSERVLGSYCVRLGTGFGAQAHERKDWSMNPAPEVNEQSG